MHIFRGHHWKIFTASSFSLKQSKCLIVQEIVATKRLLSGSDGYRAKTSPKCMFVGVRVGQQLNELLFHFAEKILHLHWARSNESVLEHWRLMPGSSQTSPLCFFTRSPSSRNTLPPLPCLPVFNSFALCLCHPPVCLFLLPVSLFLLSRTLPLIASACVRLLLLSPRSISIYS